MDCSTPGFSVHGISQARILEWVAISFPRGSLQPRDQTRVSCIGRRILYHWATREANIINYIIIYPSIPCCTGNPAELFQHDLQAIPTQGSLGWDKCVPEFFSFHPVLKKAVSYVIHVHTQFIQFVKNKIKSDPLVG